MMVSIKAKVLIIKGVLPPAWKSSDFETTIAWSWPPEPPASMLLSSSTLKEGRQGDIFQLAGSCAHLHVCL